MGKDSVVCAVDDSEEARAALRFSARLGSRLGLRLLVVHVQPAPLPSVPLAERDAGDLVAAEVAEIERLLVQLVREQGLEGCETRAELGTTVERLVAVATEEQAALVVVGSRGRAGLASTLFGSVSNEVSGRAPCPVVVVPRDAEFRI